MSDGANTIGFNDDVTVGDVTFHVQTEVVGTPAKVMTTVMQAGRLAHSERRPYPDGGDLDATRAAIERQHLEVVDRVRRGEVA